MTAVEWLIDQMFKQGYFDGNKPLSITNLDHLQHQAKEMEKQQIIDAYWGGLNGSINDYSESKQVGSEIIDIKYGKGAEQYYTSTYGSKGSDETLKDYHIVDTNEMVDQVPDVRKMVDNWDNIFDKIESEYDCHIPLKVVNYLNKYYKVPTSSQTEISDEEMIQAAIKHSEIYTLKFIPRSSFIDGAKWYREQLKKKQ